MVGGPQGAERWLAPNDQFQPPELQGLRGGARPLPSHLLQRPLPSWPPLLCEGTQRTRGPGRSGHLLLAAWKLLKRQLPLPAALGLWGVALPGDPVTAGRTPGPTRLPLVPQVLRSGVFFPQMWGAEVPRGQEYGV